MPRGRAFSSQPAQTVEWSRAGGPTSWDDCYGEKAADALVPIENEADLERAFLLLYARPVGRA